jgi:hypothetical protein
MKRQIWWPMGNSPCISPWDEEKNIFSYVTWRGIDWLTWLNGKMANRIVNGRTLMDFPMTWKNKCISSCCMRGKREFKCYYDEEALIEKIIIINFNQFLMTKIILNSITFAPLVKSQLWNDHYAPCLANGLSMILKYNEEPQGSRVLRCGHKKNKSK